MSDEIVFAGLSRRDGGFADGIHLMWSPPRGSGRAIGGFDIFRRKARRGRPNCHVLAQNELAQLHARLEIRIFGARIGVYRAEAPQALAQTAASSVSHSVDFATVAPGRVGNPLTLDGVTFRQGDGTGVPPRSMEVAAVDQERGLKLAGRLQIALPDGTTAARVAVRGAPADVTIAGTGASGTSIRPIIPRARAGQQRFFAAFDVPVTQIVLTVRRGNPMLLAVEIERHDASSAKAQILDPIASVPPPPALARAAGVPICLCYEIDFDQPRRMVDLAIRVRAVLAIALRGGKAVASRLVTAVEGNAAVSFHEAAIDHVRLYVFGAARGLTVCADPPVKPEAEDEEWRDAVRIAAGVDFPITALQPALGGAVGEATLAKSRLLPGETIDEEKFADVAKLLNETARLARGHPPVLATLLERDEPANPFIELPPWPYALSLAVDAAWRRVLGCGFLDRAANLTPGERYDYRIVGRFPRREVEERLYGFHEVPTGTQLPSLFHIGPLLIRPTESATVTLGPSSAQSALRGLGRKGVRLVAAPGTRSLSIAFDHPISQLALELDPEPGQTLSYEAGTSGFLLGASGATFDGPIARRARVDLVFPEPIDLLRLKGSGFLCGVRLRDSATNADPEELVTRSAVLLGIGFEATLPPAPPLLVETENLQRPVTGGAAQDPVGQGLKEIGFALRWAPPEESNLGGAPLPWPNDIAAFPPTAAAGFHIERRRVDTGGGFEEMDGQAPPTLFVGNRGAAGAQGPLQPGSDLAAIYGPSLIAPNDRLMDVEDVLVRAEFTRAPPGSVHQYRIFSVDAIGRRSTTARLGPAMRLEKHRLPPPPRGPTERAPMAPMGVRARLLQASDPDITDADRTLLGSSDNAIVMEWAWTEAERRQDVFATEFRVYHQPNPPDILTGAFVGPALASGGGFALQAKLNQPIAADAMRGAYLNAGGYPFRVTAHGAGDAMSVMLEPALLEPSLVPAAGSFTFASSLDGAELRPAEWRERVGVISITRDTDYRFVIRDAVSIDDVTPNVRIWVGVSTADAQSYVADEIIATAPNGGRPGNESSIAAVSVDGRYYGRPNFTPPAPLASVPEMVTNEPVGTEVTTTLDLDELLAAIPIPTGGRVAIDRVATAEIAPMVRAGADGQIHATPPAGGMVRYALANIQDQADFLTQIKTGDPARVEGRFYLDFLHRFATALGGVWQTQDGPISPAGRLGATLPAKPERYFYRMRLADAAGRLSSAGAILPALVRVPSMRGPAAPEVRLASAAGGVVEAAVRVRAAYDLAHVLVFALVTPERAKPEAIATAELLRLANRRDLAVGEGLRLRLADGTILQPLEIAALTEAAIEPPDALLNIPVTVGDDRHVALWCVSLTRDRMPSPPSGPHRIFSPPAPPVVPTLAVTRDGNADLASWGAPEVGVEAMLERSRDGGANWERASPWLPATVVERRVATAAGPRLYRLAIRNRGGQIAHGPSVEVSS